MADEREDHSDQPGRTELANERTELAEDRTVQATERTFAGWMRTAFAAIGIGLAFWAIFDDFEPTWLARAVATMFVVLGIMIAITAERRACQTFDRLSTHQVVRPRMPAIRWMSWSVVLGGLVLIAGLWVLNGESFGAAP